MHASVSWKSQLTLASFLCWLSHSQLWSSLESVFSGGDIAKQLPVESKKFIRIDKDWLRIMNRAEEMRNAVAAASSELLRYGIRGLAASRSGGGGAVEDPGGGHLHAPTYSHQCSVIFWVLVFVTNLRSSLPALYTDLERCQKSLEGYLEKKRAKFPRFYFVSNPVLLQILSQGSDPKSLQPYYEKLFDSIDRVVHDRKSVNSIVQFRSIVGKDFEDTTLVQPVSAGM
jgi:dynein heavy chain